MILEHLLYSAAIALPVSLALRSRIDPQYCFIIILGSAFSPDMFKIILRGLPLLSLNAAALPGSSYLYLLDDYSHTLSALLIYAHLVGLILSLLHWEFSASVICAGIGYGAHLFADALVYRNEYTYFWPFSSTTTSLGFFHPYRLNFFGVANDAVLFVGLVLLLIAILVRKYTSPIQPK